VSNVDTEHSGSLWPTVIGLVVFVTVFFFVKLVL